MPYQAPNNRSESPTWDLGRYFLLTKTLLFVAQDDNGRAVLRGFDKENGDVVVEIDLPAKPWGAPMSYYEEGAQFIVIASGEGKNARLIALSI